MLTSGGNGWPGGATWGTSAGVFMSVRADELSVAGDVSVTLTADHAYLGFNAPSSNGDPCLSLGTEGTIHATGHLDVCPGDATADCLVGTVTFEFGHLTFECGAELLDFTSVATFDAD